MTIALRELKVKVKVLGPANVSSVSMVATANCGHVQENYDRTFTEQVYGSPLLSASEAVSGLRPWRDKTRADAVRVQYDDLASFKTAAKLLGIMDDVKV